MATKLSDKIDHIYSYFHVHKQDMSRSVEFNEICKQSPRFRRIYRKYINEITEAERYLRASIEGLIEDLKELKL